MLQKIDHVGIAVRSIGEARQFYEKGLGLVCEGIEEIPEQKIRAALFVLGETRIELLEPTSPDSPVGKFLDQRGEGIHHIAYLCDDIKGQLQQVADAGCQLMNQEPLPGAGGKKVAFLHPKSTHGVLTELCAPHKD